MKKIVVEYSQFGNTYGGLDLIQVDGKMYLQMQDCFGPDFFGPLTEEQVSAFYVLNDVPQIQF